MKAEPLNRRSARGALAATSRTKAKLGELVVLAGLVSIGCNSIAYSLTLVLGSNPWIYLVIGTALSLIAVFGLGIRLLPTGVLTERIKGVVAFERRDGALRPVVIPRYDFGETLPEHLSALLAENTAIGRAWNKSDKLGQFRVLDAGEPGKKARLLEQAVEYYVLERLSYHLQDYFSHLPNREEHQLVRLGRSDIPDVLLSNKLLEQFSRPIDEREAFGAGMEEPTETVRHITFADGSTGIEVERVVAAYGANGAIFSEFELVLPERSRVARVGPGSVCISNQDFSMTLSVEVPGFNAALPDHFEHMYLSRPDRSVDSLDVEVSIGVSFTTQALLTSAGRRYYRWVESFMEDLDRTFSFSKFIARIGWEHALTVAQVRSNESGGRPAFEARIAREDARGGVDPDPAAGQGTGNGP